MKDYILSITTFNTWANTRILNFVAAAGEDRAEMIQVSSFPSIRKTVLHILDAQTIWMSRLEGESPLVWPLTEFAGSTLDACKQLVESSREFETFTARLSEQDLTATIDYKTIKGDPFRNTIVHILMHVMNHGTFHRGQLITLLRGAGFTDLASTDMIAFFREQAK